VREGSRGGVTLEGVGKTFGSVNALVSVNMTLEPGRIHALVGQNGAGKSTCLGTIAGRVRPTTGTVTVDGREWPASVTPGYARDAGVTAIYQELSLVPRMSALDNAFLGASPARLGLVDRRTMRRRFAALSERLGVTIDPDAAADGLSLADQQMLEVMRALALDSKVLLLDEPTAALAPPERATLFSIMRELKAQGLTLIFVSHYLDEVMSISDTVTVFRNGRLVETGEVGDWSESRMIKEMLGEELAALEEVSERAGEEAERAEVEPALRVEGLSSRDGLRDVSITIRPGEIVGLGGLVGSKRSTLMRTLAGLGRGASGRIWLNGVERSIPSSPRAALRAGIALIPEDRKSDGLLMLMSARDNIMIGDLGGCSTAGVMSSGRFKARSDDLGGRYDIPDEMLNRPAGELSGGNQQKLLLARWGTRVPIVLLADEATRGIDIGAKQKILVTLRELADQGLAILFVSSELEEVTAISDRVYVLREGAIVAELDKADRTSGDRILDHAFGQATAAGPGGGAER
jgi:ABC-type sugar transport system ATPase subunit